MRTKEHQQHSHQQGARLQRRGRAARSHSETYSRTRRASHAGTQSMSLETERPRLPLTVTWLSDRGNGPSASILRPYIRECYLGTFLTPTRVLFRPARNGAIYRVTVNGPETCSSERRRDWRPCFVLGIAQRCAGRLRTTKVKSPRFRLFVCFL